MQDTYHLIKCNTCGFWFLSENNEEVDQASHTQDHVALHHAVPEWTKTVLDYEDYLDYFEDGAEMHRQYRSEIMSGYMDQSTTYSQWWIHTEMLTDEDEQ